ncbi:HEXXH motif-containing putative peptide modification protein (plasmid) [Chromobacterium amazonense]|uniref:aKG-HExxH-type peptide beta-hydroxylase n=1 Tax=Chromobacterium amazonense TaxID=1382803 RepID=UPI00237EE4C1|nr:HEXXH motif-containing putative peptide modification protein [Chromobacterium amazonense]MDE1713562.1 HEXXH motif-containing putative peptide modification protein [Chromobacterium amazonense]
MISLSADVHEATSNNGPLWFPDLAEKLSRNWSTSYDTALSSYSSSHFLSKGLLNQEASRSIKLNWTKTCTVIEVLHKHVQQIYEQQGLVFALTEEAIGHDTCHHIQEAFTTIEGVPSLYSALSQLVQRIHVLRAENDEFDISYSDPKLPFSVFVSVPATRQKYQAWRIAEGLIHEAMHLQLSLIERVVPMVDKESHHRYYSPWRAVQRPISGVLHGLYVFGVIYEWLSLIDSDHQYVRERRKEIKEEVNQIKQFASSPGLTQHGGLLAAKAINMVLAKH